MKLGFTFKDIKVGDKSNIGEVNINVQYNPGEIAGGYKLFREILKDIPEVVAEIGTGAIAFQEMNEAFDKLAIHTTEETTPEERTEMKSNSLQLVKSAINKIKEALVEENKAV